MKDKDQFCNLIFRTISRAAMVALAIATVFALTVVLTQSAQAQTLTVLHNFTDGADGALPEGGLTMDRAGNLYGTASLGGNGGCLPYGPCGTAYKLQHKGSNWIFSPLYDFSGSDGALPVAGVVFGPDGSLYGTTSQGGDDGRGTVFNLRPPATACKTALCSWTETLLYQFTWLPDGQVPVGDPIFDEAGNLYGTTVDGGNYCGQYQDPCGTVFELTPSENGWTETILYVFQGGNDGFAPGPSLIFDQSGNLYGTTARGGSSDAGTVFEMTRSGNQWTETVLYAFQGGNDGSNPRGGLIFDHSGSLYSTASGGAYNAGTVFKLTPSNGQWTFTVLYTFQGADGAYPTGNLVMDAAGSLYGTTNEGGSDNYCGTVFKLTPSGGGWTHTLLHAFTCGPDGGEPVNATPIFDANGNLYGTAACGGTGSGCSPTFCDSGCGVIWEITP
jgi:uncharacterized repeat protein (TIGR03803 family)